VVHEIGLSISHTQHHVHGAYILSHCDLAGFTKDEQLMLALLVRCHRRNIPEKFTDQLPARDIDRARKLAALLRLSAVLHRGRSAEPLPGLKLQAQGLSALKLRFPADWLAQHPLTRADLRLEHEAMEKLGIRLSITSGVAAV
jgi:exopolyphosphatase / guanosine-5'-triphosphate,3'-diphosphate pyrophosphatase